jgi:hypothetical protein
LHSAGTLYLESLSFDYQMLSAVGSVQRVVAYDGVSTLEMFTEFPHSGGHVWLSLEGIKRFREALGVSLILNTPLGQPVSLNVTYLGVQLASSTSPVGELPDDDVVDG